MFPDWTTFASVPVGSAVACVFGCVAFGLFVGLVVRILGSLKP